MNEVNENSACYWVLRFYDENGGLDDPTQIWTRIDCLTNDIVIQEETLEATVSSIWTKTITPLFNRVIGSNGHDEMRLMTVRARYDNDEEKESTEEFDWLVKNLQKIT